MPASKKTPLVSLPPLTVNLLPASVVTYEPKGGCRSLLLLQDTLVQERRHEPELVGKEDSKSQKEQKRLLSTAFSGAPTGSVAVLVMAGSVSDITREEDLATPCEPSLEDAWREPRPSTEAYDGLFLCSAGLQRSTSTVRQCLAAVTLPKSKVTLIKKPTVFGYASLLP